MKHLEFNGKIYICRQHGVKTKIEETKLYAWEEAILSPTQENGLKQNKDISQWVDISNLTTNELYIWLGY